jgi:hypothetical protein
MPSIGNDPQTAQARVIQTYQKDFPWPGKNLMQEKSDDLIKIMLHYADYGYFS